MDKLRSHSWLYRGWGGERKGGHSFYIHMVYNDHGLELRVNKRFYIENEKPFPFTKVPSSNRFALWFPVPSFLVD